MALQVKKFLSSDWLRKLFHIVAILSVVMAVTVYDQQKKDVKCVVNYVDTRDSAAAGRSDALQRDLDAIDTLIHQITNPDQAKRLQAIQNYFTQREANDKLRAANPLPSPKRCS